MVSTKKKAELEAIITKLSKPVVPLIDQRENRAKYGDIHKFRIESLIDSEINNESLSLKDLAFKNGRSPQYNKNEERKNENVIDWLKDKRS
jgi:hypothetical protein